ncbi:hypothetical protein HGRIS_001185 [Hohenbuehelia grisea]|uniref:Uncharacterized protein n=1 Tax=Hohenbuehelia grisea TaxID=104357 RepID=A0ABR3JQ18_9AGAR
MRDEVKAFVCAEMAQALAPEAGVADLAFDPETRNLQDELALDNNVDPMSPTSLLYESSQTGECNEHLEESLSEEFPRLPGAWPIGEAVNFDQLLHDFAFTDEDPIPTYRRLFFALSSNTKKLPKMLSRRCGIILRLRYSVLSFSNTQTITVRLCRGLPIRVAVLLVGASMLIYLATTFRLSGSLPGQMDNRPVLPRRTRRMLQRSSLTYEL